METFSFGFLRKSHIFPNIPSIQIGFPSATNRPWCDPSFEAPGTFLLRSLLFLRQKFQKQYAKSKKLCFNSLLGEGKWFLPGFLYRSTISSELSELATCSCASTFEVDGGSEQNQSKAVLAEFVPSFQLNRQNPESLELEVWDYPSDDQCSRESSRIIFISANHITPLWITVSRWQILSQQQEIWTSLQSNPSCFWCTPNIRIAALQTPRFIASKCARFCSRS